MKTRKISAALIMRRLLVMCLLVLSANSHATITAITAVATPQTLSADMDNTVRVRWAFQVTPVPPFISSGQYEIRDVANNVLTTVTSAINLTAAPYVATETILISAADVETWYTVNGHKVIFLSRTFTDGASGLEQRIALRLSPPGQRFSRNPTGELKITGLELQFINQLSPSPMLNAGDALRPQLQVNYTGQGTLSGRWQIAGPDVNSPVLYRNLGIVEQPLTQAQYTRLVGPDLPTAVPGSYRIRFCVIDRTLAAPTQVEGGRCPNELVAVEALYRVVETPAEIVPMTIEAPTSPAVSKDTVFAWQSLPSAVVYELQIFTDENGEQKLVTGILLPKGSASTPVSNLMDFRLGDKVRYQWRIQGLDEQGNVVGRSELREMFWKP